MKNDTKEIINELFKKNSYLKKILFSFKDIEEVNKWQLFHFKKMFDLYQEKDKDIKIAYNNYTNFKDLYSSVKKICGIKEKDYKCLHPYYWLSYENFKKWLLENDFSFEIKENKIVVFIKNEDEIKKIGSPLWCCYFSKKSYKEYVTKATFYIEFYKDKNKSPIGFSKSNDETIGFDMDNKLVFQKNDVTKKSKLLFFLMNTVVFFGITLCYFSMIALISNKFFSFGVFEKIPRPLLFFSLCSILTCAYLTKNSFILSKIENVIKIIPCGMMIFLCSSPACAIYACLINKDAKNNDMLLYLKNNNFNKINNLYYKNDNNLVLPSNKKPITCKNVYFSSLLSKINLKVDIKNEHKKFWCYYIKLEIPHASK